ncbi:family 20 glycosylhydrolase [Bacillus sp. S34]|nr:family 20 glycosylhydrolase [Bacillus sp. S34]
MRRLHVRRRVVEHGDHHDEVDRAVLDPSDTEALDLLAGDVHVSRGELAHVDASRDGGDLDPAVAVAEAPHDVFAFDPVPSDLTDAERAHVIGGQGNMWTEHVDTARKLDYQLFPRVAALAEAVVAGARSMLDRGLAG